jgi:hypothetical protein
VTRRAGSTFRSVAPEITKSAQWLLASPKRKRSNSRRKRCAQRHLSFTRLAPRAERRLLPKSGRWIFSTPTRHSRLTYERTFWMPILEGLVPGFCTWDTHRNRSLFCPPMPRSCLAIDSVGQNNRSARCCQLGLWSERGFRRVWASRLAPWKPTRTVSPFTSRYRNEKSFSSALRLSDRISCTAWRLIRPSGRAARIGGSASIRTRFRTECKSQRRQALHGKPSNLAFDRPALILRDQHFLLTMSECLIH